MDILGYIISTLMSMTIVIVVGQRFLHPVVLVNNKKIVYVMLVILGLVWGAVIDIFESPILYGGIFGIIAGVFIIIVDHKQE